MRLLAWLIVLLWSVSASAGMGLGVTHGRYISTSSSYTLSLTLADLIGDSVNSISVAGPTDITGLSSATYALTETFGATNDTIVCASPATGSANDYSVDMSSADQSVTCTFLTSCGAVPDQGDLLSETFNGTGYDQMALKSVSAGCVVDEDYDVSSIGCGFEGLGLRTVIDGGTSDTAAAIISGLTTGDERWGRFYMTVVSEGLADGEGDVIIKALDGTALIFELYLEQVSGQLTLRLKIAGSTKDYVDISAGTIYRVEFSWKDSTDTWAWRVYEGGSDTVIDDVGGNSGAGTYANAVEMDGLTVGPRYFEFPVEILFDNIDMDSTGWVGK